MSGDESYLGRLLLDIENKAKSFNSEFSPNLRYCLPDAFFELSEEHQDIFFSERTKLEAIYQVKIVFDAYVSKQSFHQATSDVVKEVVPADACVKADVLCGDLLRSPAALDVTSHSQGDIPSTELDGDPIPELLDPPPPPPANAPKYPFLTQVFIRRKKSNSCRYSATIPSYITAFPHMYSLRVISRSKNISILHNNRNIDMTSKLQSSYEIRDGVYRMEYHIYFKVRKRNFTDKSIEFFIFDDDTKECVWKYTKNEVKCLSRRRDEEKLFWKKVDPTSFKKSSYRLQKDKRTKKKSKFL